MFVPLTVNDPPFKLQPRRLIYIERNIAHLTNRPVEASEVWKRSLIVLSTAPVFEHKSGSGSLIGDGVGSYERKIVLTPEQLGHLVVQFQLLLVVIGAPHRSL